VPLFWRERQIGKHGLAGLCGQVQGRPGLEPRLETSKKTEDKSGNHLCTPRNLKDRETEILAFFHDFLTLQTNSLMAE
jgi:hypothetical protein